MRLVFGIEISEENDEYFAMAERVRDIGEDVAFPGRYPVELFPWLRYLPSWFPGAHFKRIAGKARREAESIRTILHAISTKASVSLQPSSCFKVVGSNAPCLGLGLS